jgi:hypothetical protein
MTLSAAVAASPSRGPSACKPPANSATDPAADPASTLRIGDPPAGVPASQGDSWADANVADSQAVVG